MKVFLGFARESHHQSGANMNARHTLTDGLEQFDGFLLAHVAMHSVEHIVADMLQGDVKILAYVWLLAHHIEQIERELVRISIVQTDPLHTWNIRHAADEFGDVMFAVQVHAVVGELLGYDLEFLHTIGYQLVHLIKDFIHRTGNVLAGNDRNGAIRTTAVTTFRNLDIGIMMRSSKMTCAAAFSGISLAQFLEQLLIIKLTIKLIHLGHLSLQLLLITLREATHHIELTESSLFLSLDKLQDSIDALLLGILDKAASIDNGYFTLWAFRVVNTVVAIFLEKLHQGLAVHQVFGATHGYYIYLIFLHSCPTYPNNNLNLILFLVSSSLKLHSILFLKSSKYLYSCA